MGNWKLIAPAAGVNYFTDPSFAHSNISSYYTVGGNGTSPSIAQYTGDAFIGGTCAKVTFGAGTTYYNIFKNFITGGTDAWTLSGYFKRANGGVINDTYINVRHHSVGSYADTIISVGNGWYRVSKTAVGSGSSTQYGFVLLEDGMMADALQLEIADAPTTYIDGEQPGCEWQDIPFNGRSARSALSREGGIILDLKDDLGFGVVEVIGTELASEDISLDTYANVAGGIVTGMSKKPRTFTLTGHLVAETGTSLDDRLDTLKRYLDSETTPGNQMVTLWYTGADVWKSIKAHYKGGLDAAYSLDSTNLKTTLKASLQFVAPDPYWYFIGEGSIGLDTYQYITEGANNAHSIAAWQRLNVQDGPGWNGLDHSSGNANVYAIAYNPFDNNLYIAGAFSSWNGVSGRDRIVKYDLYTRSYATVGSSSDFANGAIYALAVDPSTGYVYAGGSFTTTGGSVADYLAVYNGTSWSGIVSGQTGTVYALACDWYRGDALWVGGNFADFGGDADADNLCWILDLSGTPYVDSFTSGGPNGQVNCLLSDPSKKMMYVGGNFTTCDGGTFSYVFKCDISSGGAGGYTPEVLGNAYNDVAAYVNGVAIDSEGDVIIVGNFSSVAGDSNCKRAARWNGYIWEELGDTSAISTEIFSVGVGPDDRVWMLVPYSTQWKLVYSENKILHDSYIICGGSNDTAKPIVCIHPEPSVKQDYDIIFATQDSGLVQAPYTTTVTNVGSARTYPTIRFNTLDLTYGKPINWLWNHTTGKIITSMGNFTYSLPKDVLDWVLKPGEEIVKSTLAGKLKDSWADPGSQVSEFYLLPGENIIDCSGGDTGQTEIILTWKIAYNGMSG